MLVVFWFQGKRLAAPSGRKGKGDGSRRKGSAEGEGGTGRDPEETDGRRSSGSRIGNGKGTVAGTDFAE